MLHRAYKQRLYPQFARVAHALGSDRRLEILDLLAQAPRHVEALAAETEMSVANVSQHLQVLRAAHLVESERDGTRVIYRLAGPDVLRLWLALRTVAAERIPEVPQIAHQFAVAPEGDDAMTRTDLHARLARRAVTIIDVRPAVEFESGHLPGAISAPVDALPSLIDELPRDRPVVAYCRGTYCLFADEAVALLRERGFEAYRLLGGWPEWLAEDLPVSKS
jgi:rhodanese-related sulfurtransferase/DNA-binding transcriptional ArsR family regulator